jgi:hypothetical protein
VQAINGLLLPASGNYANGSRWHARGADSGNLPPEMQAQKTATKKAGARPAFSWIAAYAEINFPNT